MPSIKALVEEETRRLTERLAEGGSLEAAARVLIYISKAGHRVEESPLYALRKLLLSNPEVSPKVYLTRTIGVGDDRRKAVTR